MAASAAILLFALAAPLHGQGILTVTPSRTVATTAGTGTVGYTGDTGPATAATLANPAAVAYDTHGNLFLADANNHVIREISTSGVITTIAGTGVEGYAGDGAAATSAQLDTPTGVAVDAAGNVYIADSHNHRIREVSTGIITTIAGTGTPGFSGDGAAATAAQLALPSGVAVDASGNLYIADTNNHRIRKVSGGTITTLAGDGEELYAGDGGSATAAALDSPTGVAVDASDNVYIADRLNQRIREVSGGTITTLAGSSTAGFSGDGASPAAATLAKPSGVSVDAAGNVYIADTDNQRIREVGNGAIATIEGSGAQGYGGDGGLSTAAILNSPRSVAPDASGNLAIADRLNQRLRSGTLPTLTFPAEDVGIPSPAQSVTLANTGSASITVSSITPTAGFTTAAGGTCSAPPITLAAGATCTQNLELLPVAAGPSTGSVVFTGTGIVPQSILLTGSATSSPTTVTLTSSVNPALAGQPITYTATVTPTGLGTPTGTVAFDAAGTPFSTPDPRCRQPHRHHRHPHPPHRHRHHHRRVLRQCELHRQHLHPAASSRRRLHPHADPTTGRLHRLCQPDRGSRRGRHLRLCIDAIARAVQLSHRSHRNGITPGGRRNLHPPGRHSGHEPGQLQHDRSNAHQPGFPGSQPLDGRRGHRTRAAAAALHAKMASARQATEEVSRNQS